MFAEIGLGATILGIFITLAAWINGRTVKRVVREEGEKTREILDKVVLMVREEGEKTREILDKMVPILERMERRDEAILEVLKKV